MNELAEPANVADPTITDLTVTDTCVQTANGRIAFLTAGWSPTLNSWLR
ncbi:hypothetical protein [Streptomyces sp. NPDC002265]